VIICCVVYGFRYGLGVRGLLVCSTSSGFCSGCCSRWGFFGLRFPLCVCVFVCVCVCVCARARAWLGAFGISTGEKEYLNKRGRM